MRRRIRIKLLVHEVDDDLSNQDIRKLIREALQQFPYRISLGHPHSIEKVIIISNPR